MSNVLVTGAAGFIGSHLVEALVAEGHQVRAMTHYNFQNNWGWLETLPADVLDNVEILPSDVSDPFAVSKAVKGMERVFHLAALIAIPYSYQAPASYVQTNITGTLNVLQACLEHDVERLVHTSTSETYGTAQYVPIDEKHPLVGQSPYSASKIAADQLALSFHLSFDLPVVTVRPFNTFGPRQSARAIIPTIVTQALSGINPIRLGSLTPVRDLTYVTDTARGFILASEAEKCHGLTLNLGRGEGIAIGDLAQLILDSCGSSAQILTDQQRVRPEKSEVMALICNAELAREQLGWRSQVSMQEGIEHTIQFIRRNLTLYKPHNYNM